MQASPTLKPSVYTVCAPGLTIEDSDVGLKDWHHEDPEQEGAQKGEQLDRNCQEFCALICKKVIRQV